jgi:hypothetical protein
MVALRSHDLAGQRESIFAIILSARDIASEMAASDAGVFLPSHCDSLRVARMQAAIKSTRFLPSSMFRSVAYSLFIRHPRICLFISKIEILHRSKAVDQQRVIQPNYDAQQLIRIRRESGVAAKFDSQEQELWQPPKRRANPAAGSMPEPQPRL